MNKYWREILLICCVMLVGFVLLVFERADHLYVGSAHDRVHQLLETLGLAACVFALGLVWRLSRKSREFEEEVEARRRAEEGFNKQLRLMHGILRNMPAVAFRIDEHGVFTESQGAGLERMGLKDRQEVGENMLERYTQVRPWAEQALSGSAVHYRSEGIHLGKPWVFDNILAFDKVRGSGAIGFSIDITERMRAEQERDRLFNLSIDMLCIAGLDGYFKRINPAFERTLGWPAQVLLSQPFMTFVHPDDRYATTKAMSTLRDGKPLLHFDNRYLCRDGSYRWISWHARSFVEAGLIYAVARDVTDRKKSEQALQESEQKWRSLAENVPDVITTVALDGTIQFINHPLSGMQPEQVIGRSVYEFLGHPYRAAVRAGIEKVGRQGRAPSCEVQGLGTDSYRWYTARFGPVTHQGGVVAVNIISSDITEQKRAEELRQRHHELVQTELEKAKEQLVRQTRLAAIGQVAASIAHDLRNPLGTIRNAQYYLKNRVPESCEKWGQYLSIIEDEVSIADQIINNLMHMSRAKRPVKRRVDLEEAARAALIRTEGAEQVELNCVFDRSPYVVEADPAHLGQVLTNLFTNSVHAMDGVGRITLEAQNTPGGYAIRIEDTGPGIPEAIRERVFEPLVTNKAKGTGLGLSICRQIIDLHGGWIEVGQGDSGAVFQVLLPSGATTVQVDDAPRLTPVTRVPSRLSAFGPARAPG